MALLCSALLPAAGPPRLQSARTAPPRGHSRASPPRSGRPRDELLGPRGLSRGPLAALIGSETSTSGPRPERALSSSRPLPKGGTAAPGRRSVPSPWLSPAQVPRRAGVAGLPQVGPRPRRKSARARWLSGSARPARRGGGSGTAAAHRVSPPPPPPPGVPRSP